MSPRPETKAESPAYRNGRIQRMKRLAGERLARAVVDYDDVCVSGEGGVAPDLDALVEVPGRTWARMLRLAKTAGGAR